MSTLVIEQTPGEAQAGAELADHLSPLRLKLSRLSSLTQGLAPLPGAEQAGTHELLAALDRSGASLRQIHELLEREDRLAAATALADVRAMLPDLQRRLAEVAESIPPLELQRYLSEVSNMPADALAILVECLAAARVRTDASRQKLVSAAGALARAHGGDADNFSETLAFHGIRFPQDDPVLPEQLVLHQRELKDNLSRLQARPSELLAFSAELQSFKAELGDRVYTATGLSALVALESAFEHKKDSHDGSQVQAFFDLASELEVAIPEPEAASPEQEDVSPAKATGLELLEELESQLLSALADGRRPAECYQLESHEVKALGADLAKGEPLLVRGAACRAALEHLARHQAGGGCSSYEACGTPGQDAHGMMLQEARRLESELQQRVQGAVVAGRSDEARRASRALHGLSEARQVLEPRTQPVESVSPPGDTSPKKGSAAAQPQAVSRRSRSLRRKQRQVQACSSPTTAFDPLAPGVEPARPWLTRRRLIGVALVAVAIVTWGFHAERPQEVAPGKRTPPPDLLGGVPLQRFEPVSGALLATAEPDWERSGDVVVRRHVERMWDETRQLGFDSLVLMSADERPIARANKDGLLIMALSDGVALAEAPDPPGRH